MEPRIWLIAGPTASGKSALALALARETGAEIVNSDSMQLYADLRVLSARPDAAEEAHAPHHLFGIADAAEAWSTGRWLRAATQVLDELAARDRPAVVVGGTGLYFRALTDGLAEIPAVPGAARRAAEARFDTSGEDAVRDDLRTLDPQAQTRIAPGDRQRLVRALEVARSTGRSISDWQADTHPVLASGSWRGVVLDPPREALYARCDARFDAMLAAGALEEVRALAARNLDPALPAMGALGVRDLAAYLAGTVSLEDATIRAKQATRHYAKRQLTWFRNQTADWPRVTATQPAEQWAQLRDQVFDR
ncbi:MAG: tRNA (adenosine(37)-N6)-dimethylallyltransferase MiaA [Phenylobacterium sp.]|uniref:tRNA (adenosine(37)-N6)-dimethylallyltransferase MiaA n=1 Tax=Phenylobacterium sp. TaxID=1871053 RepID=UPI00273414CB|nr:tRNA (adenosine(37)-N6)-dimethylallyltransferase MiaA [Phenylobacterium sp.]MDP3175322.1 tRNA (adenosine(37)-N6)-dimethylallyltransferase MiaA [Phenylobacterium sp.]